MFKNFMQHSLEVCFNHKSPSGITLCSLMMKVKLRIKKLMKTKAYNFSYEDGQNASLTPARH